MNLKIALTGLLIVGSLIKLTAQIEVVTNDQIKIGSGADKWIFDKSSGYPIFYTTELKGIIGKSTAELYQLYAENIWLKTAWLTSDENTKENIKDMHECLKKVKKVKGVTYDFKAKPVLAKDSTNMEGNNPDTLVRDAFLYSNRKGFIAQDLQQVYPELVYTHPETGMMSIDYIGLIPVLTNALNEQQNIIEKQDSLIKSQNDAIAAMQLQIKDILSAIKKPKN